MTLQEFITTNPTDYGLGNVNLLYSSSVSGAVEDDPDQPGVPVPPYFLQGATIPFDSINNVSIISILNNIEFFIFGMPTGSLRANITGRQRKIGYFYYTFEPISLTELPSTTDSQGLIIHESSQFVFSPFTTTGFNNNDYNPLINNSERSKPNSKARIVDRTGDAAIPTNMQAILSQSAAFAEIQNCSYTKAGIINGRYNGSKTTTAGPLSRVYNKEDFTAAVIEGTIPGNEPALNLVTFKGSLHASDAKVDAIKAILNADREVTDILFNSTLSGSHPNKVFPNFPVSSSFVYGIEGGRIFKLTNQKIYSIDTDEVLTTNNLGGITLVQ